MILRTSPFHLDWMAQHRPTPIQSGPGLGKHQLVYERAISGILNTFLGGQMAISVCYRPSLEVDRRRKDERGPVTTKNVS